MAIILVLIVLFYALLALTPQGSFPTFRLIAAIPLAICVGLFLLAFGVVVDGREGLRDGVEELRRSLRDLPDMIDDLKADLRS